jgi:hypothetical protein
MRHITPDILFGPALAHEADTYRPLLSAFCGSLPPDSPFPTDGEVAEDTPPNPPLLDFDRDALTAACSTLFSDPLS